MKKPKFQKPSGMHDILPRDQKYFKRISEVVEDIADFYGFEKIDTPILEDAELFAKGTGATTDVVKKEMYTLKTRGGDYLALRPEGTPSIARAYIEHGMSNRPQPVKLYYLGPFFRYERPQAGRYRQFWQFGFEVIGEGGSIIDAQMIQLFYGLLTDLGIKNSLIEINTIGDRECRPAYRRILVRYLKSRSSSLCTNCKRRLKENPLRVLDCKEKKCRETIEGAPQMINYLCADCHEHFKHVLEYLDEIELPYQLNPHLVRGLDYYTRTVFEFFAPDGDEEKLALGGGGRYDDLVRIVGGKDAPAIGGAFGMERIVELLKELGVKESKKEKKIIFIAQLGDMGKRKGLKMIEEFRKAKITVRESLNKDSLRAQMSRAARVGARYTLIIGQREALEESVIVRDMETGQQETIKIKDIISKIKKELRK